MKTLLLIALLAIFLIAGLTPALADTFSLTVPAGTEVVMADPQAVISVTVRNNGPTRDIRSITFNIDTAKYAFSAATVPPAGWCVNSVSDGSINFQLVQSGGSCTSGSTSRRIEPLESVVFNIGVVPVASASDSTDGFSTVSVSTQNGFTMSGAAPSWTRRSLEAAITASPASAGTGDIISVTMQITNRSTLSKSALTSSPDPPSPSSPIVSAFGGPFYASTLLTNSLNASSATANVASTAGFPSSGSIFIDSEEVCYSGKTTTSFTGVSRGCNGTTAASHSSGSIAYGLDPFSLAPGETGAVIWTFNADSSGEVYFTARASTGASSSALARSNSVLIGDFTASLNIAPSSVISGQDITVEMTVTNNGNSALVNVAPSLLNRCAGGATETLVSGPSPALIPSLSKGSSGVFSWTYRITGGVGQAYCLTGTATANGPVITNTAASNSGQISVYSVTTAPSVVSSGAANVTINWTVYNGGGCDLRTVSIGIPSVAWSCSSVNPPAGWQAGCDASLVTFTSERRRDELPPGATGTYSITFSAVETVTGDKTAAFPVSVIPRGCGGETVTLGSYITVSANSMVLSYTPAGPLYADGSSYYDMTATLTSGGAPLAGKTVTFSTTGGSLSASSATTDVNGLAKVRLVSPVSTANTSSTVTAEYLEAQDTDTVNFFGWNKPNIQYWGGLSPVAVSCGSSYSFTMQLKNIASSSMTLGLGSYFSFNDSTALGSSVFQAYINSPVTISPGATQAVSFGSPSASGGGGGVVLASSFMAGVYEPAANSVPPPASGLFLTDGGTNDQYRTVADSVTTGGSCGTVRVRVIDWHEMM